MEVERDLSEREAPLRIGSEPCSNSPKRLKPSDNSNVKKHLTQESGLLSQLRAALRTLGPDNVLGREGLVHYRRLIGLSVGKWVSVHLC